MEYDLVFNTARHIFSPNAIDKGTLAMLSFVDFHQHQKILDLGYGYGIVGILAAKIIGGENVMMSDISERCIDISKHNAVLNGFHGITFYVSEGFKQINDTNFTGILCNPPYHTDFSVAKHFIEKGFNRLALHGRMYMVTKRLDWYRNKLQSIFGGVTVREKDGYYVFIAEKRMFTYSKASKNM
jgi:16S rRNA (guanine1207-N2)-methyltransferase